MAKVRWAAMTNLIPWTQTPQKVWKQQIKLTSQFPQKSPLGIWLLMWHFQAKFHCEMCSWRISREACLEKFHLFFFETWGFSGSNPPRWWNFKGRAFCPHCKLWRWDRGQSGHKWERPLHIDKAELQRILTLQHLHTTGRPVPLRMVIGEEKTDRHGTRCRAGKQRVIKPFSFSPSRSKYKPALWWQS